MGSATGVEEQFGFSSVGTVLPDPFLPGTDTRTVRLPTVPRVRSPQDDDAHHRAYWQAHLWAVLHRYRRAFLDPSCPMALREGYPAVAEDAFRLAQRAGASHPISPIDSVACHAALKDLVAACVTLEATVAALRAPRADAAARMPVAGATLSPAPGATTSGATDSGDMASDRTALGAKTALEGTDVDGALDEAAAGVAGQDFFPTSSASRPFELSLSLRGSRGLLRRRKPATPTTGTPAVE